MNALPKASADVSSAHSDCGATPVRVSVIVPARNAQEDLRQSLAALSASDGKFHEVIVVDDGSEDQTAAVAEQSHARVIRLPESRGPAYARNRGAEAATGDLFWFVDADVCVAPSALGRIRQTFAGNPQLAALMGSYDDAPADPDFVSQYKNLSHHYIHQQGNPNASTFWSGCGAVRREVFLRMGGFHEGYSSPCIEDIEFGFRLRKAGHSIRLNKEVQGKHLKRWRLGGLIKTDVYGRGVPWVVLMLRDRFLPADLNLTWHSRVSTLLAYLLLATVPALINVQRSADLLPTLLTLLICIFGAWCWKHRLPLAFALAIIGAVGIVMGVRQELTWGAVIPILLLMALPLLNAGYYQFFHRKRGTLFALGVLPLHLLFFLYSGLCLPLGLVSYLRDSHQVRSKEGSRSEDE